MDHEWAAAAEPPPVPVPERRGDQVYVGEQRLGRVSFSHEPRSRMFLYCHTHQCYKCVALSKGPYMSGAIKWVAAALKPEVTSRKDHLDLFEEYVVNP